MHRQSGAFNRPELYPLKLKYSQRAENEVIKRLHLLTHCETPQTCWSVDQFFKNILNKPKQKTAA